MASKMAAEMGEYVVGAYLKLELACDVIDYNVRAPGGGLAGLAELDVIGLSFQTNTAYLCEVTTHVRGMLYGTNLDTIERIRQKHDRQKAHAAKFLGNFQHHRFMLWSPNVPVGAITKGLKELDSLELIINQDYTAAVNSLQARAKDQRHDTGNPFFRALQILACLR